MAILFDWYELPEPKDKQREEKILHPRIRLNGSTTTDERQVHLDGIGYFHPVLTSTEPVTAATKRKTTKIKLKGIKFRADQVLKNEIGAIKVKPLGLNEHSQKLSDKEIDRRLTGYFSTHQFLTRESFQVLCGMMRSTAQLHIRLLRSEGKLENVGKLNQPIYVPCTGYYGRDE